MDCQQFLNELSDYLDGVAGRGVREAIEEHTAFCRKCQVIYSSTRRTLEIATECGTDTYRLPESASERLLERVRAWMLSRQAGKSALESRPS